MRKNVNALALAEDSHLIPDMENSPEADFILVESANSCWITVDGFSVWVRRVDGGVEVEISARVNGETQDEILDRASAYEDDGAEEADEEEGPDRESDVMTEQRQTPFWAYPSFGDSQEDTDEPF